jgi:hypothetical protein
LPEGFAINLKLKDQRSGDILEEALIGRSEFGSKEHVTPGPHAYDGSYTELELAWRDINIQVRSASVNNELYLLITPLNSVPGDALIIDPEMLWGREGDIAIDQGVISSQTPSSNIQLAVRADQFTSTSEDIMVSLNRAIAVSSAATVSVEDITKVINGAQADLLVRNSAFRRTPELYNAMQTVLAWNVIYEPKQNRVITPVSRVWNVDWKGWILFEWDTYFTAYMFSLGNKKLAYANAIAITKEITGDGFVPNFASAVTTSEDRSEPPVGSFVVKEIYRKYREEWFLREVFDELLSWNRWWADYRDVNGYLTWGSDPYEHGEIPEWLIKGVGTRKGAKWESGLDNSPMWDDAVFDTTTCRYLFKTA